MIYINTMKMKSWVLRKCTYGIIIQYNPLQREDVMHKGLKVNLFDKKSCERLPNSPPFSVERKQR